MSRRAPWLWLALALVVALGANAPARAGAFDADETRTSPVPHRYLHGRLGDADFQIALPHAWNGKIVISTRGFSGDEFQNDAIFKQLALLKGYAYAASDEGWNRYTIAGIPRDKYFESRRRIVQLTNYTRGVLQRHYGRPVARTYLAGSSNGGHHTKWLVEDYPALYDGGLSMFGYNSALEIFRAFPIFLRNYDVIAPRIADIVAARAADPAWDPATDPLSPPLTPEQIAALGRIYDVPAVLKNGFAYNVGRAPGSEVQWAGAYGAIVGYLGDSMRKLDPTWDPDGDGAISVDEIKAWDPYLSPINVQNELRKLDLSGNLRRPMIIGQGTADPLVSAFENIAYRELVETVLGPAGADGVLRVYLIPGMGHGGPQNYPFVDAALDALDQWVDFVESGGAAGAVPDTVTGLPHL